MKGTINNAEITDTSIIKNPVLSAYIFVKFESSSQAFGGHCLYNKNFKGDCAGKFIERVLDVVGVNEWEELKGKNIRVDHDLKMIYGIGNILKDEWFYPSEELK